MFNSRHPGPSARVEGRVRAAVDDTVLPGSAGSAGSGGKAGESQWLVFEQRSTTFGYLAGPRTAQKHVLEQLSITFSYKCLFGSNTPLFATFRVLRRRPSPASPRGSSGKVWRSSGRALGGSLYRQTPDKPPQRPLCFTLIPDDYVNPCLSTSVLSF